MQIDFLTYTYLLTLQFWTTTDEVCETLTLCEFNALELRMF